MMSRLSKVVFTLCAGVISFISNDAFAYTVLGMEPPSSIEFQVGYRQDDVKWKVFTRKPDFTEFPPDPFIPPTKSTLDFKDLAVVQMSLTGKYFVNCWCYIRGYAVYGRIFKKNIHEKNRFTIFNPLDFSVSTENPMRNHGYMGDYSIGIGNHFQLMEGRLTAAPMVGYGYHIQEISTKNNERAIDGLITAITGSSPRRAQTRDSNRYRTYWMGPWFGLDLFYNTVCNWLFFSEIEYYFASRCAVKRHSHTGINFFDDYRKTNTARGFNTRIGGDYYFCPHWYFGFNLKYEYWKSHKVRRRINWRSMGLGLQLGYVF